MSLWQQKSYPIFVSSKCVIDFSPALSARLKNRRVLFWICSWDILSSTGNRMLIIYWIITSGTFL